MPHWSLCRPASSTRLMVNLAEHKHGIAPGRCLDGSGLRPEDLAEPSRSIRGRQELTVLRNILAALDPTVPFGLEAGLDYRATTFGMLGFAFIASPNSREALELAVRYFELTPSFSELSYAIDAHCVHLQYEDSATPDDLRLALIERDLASLLSVHRDILGGPLPIEHLELRARRPPYADALSGLFGVRPRWGAQANRVALRLSWLDASSPFADEAAMRLCEQQCETALQQRMAADGARGQVLQRLRQGPSQFPGMSSVARELGVSTRTLRNQLSQEGTSYRALLDEVREGLAEELLAGGQLTIDAIAVRLGYSDASAFSVAFKRWKGRSPRSDRSARK